ncbi:MAG: sugar phosphate isomerase/epimerase [Clostridiales bacterium]|nr:sugar phosphate isomerase/epimerase [Clostridiales bacterium]
MKIGISTSSLFGRYPTEDALAFLNRNNVQTVEVFLESFSEYNKEFGKLLSGIKGDTDVHSLHVLTTQYEPQLYSVNERAKVDSFKILEMAMQAGKEIGAKYYTFHGVARIKRTPLVIDFDRVAKITQDIIEVLKKYSITLAYENVHWSYYNYIGFFNELRKRTVGLKGTLDIKQARQSDIHYKHFIDEMGKDIVTVHLSDVDENGKMCLPGKGVTDFYDLFSRLSDVGFDGAFLIEAYKSDFEKESELFESVEFLKEVACKTFK